MNQIGHKSNNTIFDVELTNFKRLSEIYDGINLSELSKFSIEVPYVKFTRLEWESLILLINPFNSKHSMNEIQKKSFVFYKYIIDNIAIKDLIFICNNVLDEIENTFLTMIGIVNNGVKLLTLIENKTKDYNLDKIVWDIPSDNSQVDPIFKIARYGNLYNFKFMNSKINQIFNKTHFFFGNIFVCLCFNPDMRILKYYLEQHSSNIKLDEYTVINGFRGIFLTIYL